VLDRLIESIYLKENRQDAERTLGRSVVVKTGDQKGPGSGPRRRRELREVGVGSVPVQDRCRPSRRPGHGRADQLTACTGFDLTADRVWRITLSLGH
jgi:hypothetical protein